MESLKFIMREMFFSPCAGRTQIKICQFFFIYDLHIWFLLFLNNIFIIIYKKFIFLILKIKLFNYPVNPGNISPCAVRRAPFPWLRSSWWVGPAPPASSPRLAPSSSTPGWSRGGAARRGRRTGQAPSRGSAGCGRTRKSAPRSFSGEITRFYSEKTF